MLTAIGLTLGIGSGTLFAGGAWPFAFALGVLSVFCDVLDGTLARKFHLESKSGLIFDSAADRGTECAVVAGAFAAGIIQPLGLVAVVGSVALLVMRAISYKRGLRTDYVLFGRFERLAFILAGLLVPTAAVSTVCFVIAGGFGLVSAAQIGVTLLRKGNRSK
jgi:phosphatidylglycerophosphate synthase